MNKDKITMIKLWRSARYTHCVIHTSTRDWAFSPPLHALQKIQCLAKHLDMDFRPFHAHNCIGWVGVK